MTFDIFVAILLYATGHYLTSDIVRWMNTRTLPQNRFDVDSQAFKEARAMWPILLSAAFFSMLKRSS